MWFQNINSKTAVDRNFRWLPKSDSVYYVMMQIKIKNTIMYNRRTSQSLRDVRSVETFKLFWFKRFKSETIQRRMYCLSMERRPPSVLRCPRFTARLFVIILFFFYYYLCVCVFVHKHAVFKLPVNGGGFMPLRLLCRDCSSFLG